MDLKAQYRLLKSEMDQSLIEVLEGGGFVLGERLEKFEACFAQYLECRHAVGVSSGLDALRLALEALDIGPGDEVIIPANTFIATAFAVSAVRARPVLVDMDIAQFQYRSRPHRTSDHKCHARDYSGALYGQPADMEAIVDIAHRHKLFVIEDACQAHGARYKGKRTGTLGDMAVSVSIRPRIWAPMAMAVLW